MTCKHEVFTIIGWKDNEPDNYRKYYINREKSKRYGVDPCEVSICNDCGALLDSYQEGAGVMTERDIAHWIDSLIDMRLQDIVKFVESVE